MNNSLMQTQMESLMKTVSNCLVEALVVVSLCTLGLCKNKKKLNDTQVMQMTLVLTVALVLVDSLSPSLSGPLRQGVGFGVGAMMVGFP